MTEADMGSGIDAASLAALGASHPEVFFTCSGPSALERAPWPDVVHPEDEEALRVAWREAVQRGTELRITVRLHDEGGPASWSLTGSPLRDAAGSVLCWIVTKRRAPSEETDRSSIPDVADLFRAICSAATEAIFVKGLDGRYLYVNPTCAAVFGAAAASIVGTDDDAWFGPEVGARLRADDRTVVEVTQPIHRDEDLFVGGHHRHFSTFKIPYRDEGGTVRGIIGIARDVSQLRREHVAVREERDMYATIADVVPGAFLSFRRTADGAFELPYATLAIVDLLGATPDELERDPSILLGITHPDDRARLEEAIARSAFDRLPIRCELRLIHPRRGEIWVELLSGPSFEADGSTLWHGFMLDATGRKGVESELRASEERYRRLVELLPDAVFVHSGGKLTFCNAAFMRLMNAETREQLLGMSPHDIVHPEHHPLLDARLARMRERHEAVPPIELSVVTLDRVRRWVSVVATPIVDRGEPAILVVLHDLTDRRKLEDQFRQAHKMEAFGQLAGGVAHDFNNLLTVILSESSLLLSSLPAEAQQSTPIQEIQKAGERAAGLTRQLLAFSRRTVLEPKVLDLNVTVHDTEKLLQRLIGEDVRLSTSLTPRLNRVHVDPGQFVQVIMNLAVNARDAMPRGGHLDIATANTVLDDAAAESLGLRPGPYVKLTVSDDGTGMTPEVRARIFQPFFTTKGIGHGTGLGLAVVHGIVTQSGGAIEVRSEVGVGTAVDIYLPVSRVASSPTIAAVTPAATRGSGVVLVVEDDAALQRLARRILVAKGYTVLVADDGARALDVLEARTEPVDLVVTDVVMPTMGGGELGQRLRVLYPELKILYVSGYTSDVLLRRGLQSEAVEFLAKPYTPESLATAVSRALHEAD